MKTAKMPGLLCRSDIATSVCVPDPRSIIAPRRPDRTLHAGRIDVEYSRLRDPRRMPKVERRRPVTLPMVTKTERAIENALPPPLPIVSTVFQVVVMRVSIHCQGCAGKVRKHISKMEGVTSFSIDLESKRVTVMGHVSPIGVLQSISKVKKAEFWNC